MNKYKNIKELYNDFILLESKYSLIDLEIDNIKIWQAIRWNVFTTISAKIFGLGQAHINSSKSNKLKQIVPMIYNSIFNNGFFAKPHDILVFPHDRVRLVDGEYIDINTKYFIDDLLSQGKDLLVMEKPYTQKHFTKKNSYTKYLDDSILFSSIFKKFVKVNLQEYKIINLLINDIKKLFGVDIDLYFIIKDKIKLYKVYYKFYYKLLSHLKPKQIYMVVCYSYPWLVQVAKDLNIEVIELQHGAFSKYHLGYSYHNNSVNYYPDKFLVWNNYWKNIIRFPLKKEQIDIYPFIFQEREIKKYQHIKKERNKVVVLSQGPISNKMAKIILDNFDFFKDKVIEYKLHPGELQRYKSYPYLMKLLEKDNVSLSNSDNLYELLAKSEYQVGVYSTAIYEGIEFNCKTILCNTMFVEYMEKLIEDNKIYKILYEK